MPGEKKLSYEFGPYRLDTGDLLLYRNHQPVPLPPKVMDTLLALVQNNGCVMAKEVLMEKVWPDVAVEENNLTQNVSVLRKTLGDGAGGRKFIETIPRRGYRFVAPVKEVTPSAQRWLPAISRRWSWLFAPALLALAAALVMWSRAGPLQPALRLRQLTYNSSELPLTAGAISPNGKYLAYFAATAFHLKLLDTGEIRLLPSPPFLSITAVSWFPDNSRVLASAISAQDTSCAMWIFGLHGETPRRISGEGIEAAVSPDGMRIVYLATDSREIWVAGSNGESPRRILSARETESFGGVRWSPSGDRIGFGWAHQTPADHSGKSSSQLDLATIDAEGGKPVRIPFDSGISGGVMLASGRFLYASRINSLLTDWRESALWERRLDRSSWRWLGPAKLLSNLGAGAAATDFSVTSDGRRLVFLKREPQCDVYIAELEAHEDDLRNVRRLTFDDHNDFLSSWSLDSRALFFASDRSGNFDVYRQAINEQTAHGIISGSKDELGVKLGPDGAYYYGIPAAGWRSTITRPLVWMRVPSNGGAAQPVFSHPVPGIIDCAISSHACVYGEGKNGELIVSSFDPETGLGKELTRVNANRWYRFGLSPDGSRLAVALADRIRIIVLDSGHAQDIFATGWTDFDWVSWSPDGKGLYVTCQPPGRTVILHMDLHGHAQSLFETAQAGESAVLPSPDGKRLAFGRWTSANNAWIVEGL